MLDRAEHLQRCWLMLKTILSGSAADTTDYGVICTGGDPNSAPIQGTLASIVTAIVTVDLHAAIWHGNSQCQQKDVICFDTYLQD